MIPIFMKETGLGGGILSEREFEASFTFKGLFKMKVPTSKVYMSPFMNKFCGKFRKSSKWGKRSYAVPDTSSPLFPSVRLDISLFENYIFCSIWNS